MDLRRRQRTQGLADIALASRALASRALAGKLGLLLIIVIVLVLLNALMIAGATNCASEAPDVRCAIAGFVAG